MKNENHVESQCNAIINHLMTKGTLTSAQAYELYGTLKLPTRVSELLTQKFPIKKETIKVTNRHGKEVRVTQYSM
jgi:hypothetical protein